jgi:hypothetical protein
LVFQVIFFIWKSLNLWISICHFIFLTVKWSGL